MRFFRIFEKAMRKHKDHIVWMLILAFVISLFMLFTARVTSPLYPNTYGTDSAYFRYAGKEILRHKTPYIDFWDHKGPVIFFIQAAGALFGTTNRDGINLLFIMQIGSLFFCILMLLKIDLLLHQAESFSFRRFLLITLFSLAILFRSGQNLNLTEDWSFPFICLSLYLFFRYTLSSKFSVGHPPVFAFLHGICIGMITFIRINNSVSILAGAVVIGIFLLYKKQYKNVLMNILCGAAGIAFVVIPLFFWFAKRNALAEMIDGTFLYNLRYMSDKVIIHFRSHAFLQRYLPLIAGAILIALHLLRKKSADLTDMLVLTIMAANGVLLIRTNTFFHYFAIFVPVYFMILLLCLRKDRRTEWAIALLVFGYFCVMDAIQFPDMLRNMREPRNFNEVKRWIPQNERKSVIAIDITPEIYLNTGLEPISRYGAFQEDLFLVNNDIKEQFFADLREKQPLWVIAKCKPEKNYPETLEFLENGYQERYREHVVNDDICFYRQNTTSE